MLGLWLVLAFIALPQQVAARQVVADVPDSPEGYGSLSELVVLIGEDAAGQFADFFAAGPVRVTPFKVIGEGLPRRTTLLGATLADQMTAVINSVPEAEAERELRPARDEQLLRGVLQELDGYLRIHISGRNNRGQWRSYVANVEMSEAVYRALHTYVTYGR
ncbi:hypothetical protein [Desulfurivibrio alkaliphilus]|uniref:hypothetical protein n=1 Tax=Desulfurivibrio alkaliphilus TaxID=427923 RepID=UPI0002E45437|nr:hypothetical protein [Desulfurivibrio alkaliphilus]